jgi:hypothetical protein
LTRLVYEVDSLEMEYERIQAAGGEALITPTFVQGGFGSQRLACLCSPGGFVIEDMQVFGR